MSDELITQEQLADHLGVTVSTVRKWRYSGKIAFIRVGSTVRFERDAIDSFIDAHRVPAVAEPA